MYELLKKDGKAAHRITIQIQLCDLPGMRDADILVDPALVDPSPCEARR